MLKKVFVFIGIIFAILLIVLIIKTIQAEKKPFFKATALIDLPDSAVQHMSSAIQIPTITPNDTVHIDSFAFKTFQHFLEVSYPMVHQHLKRVMINDFNYIFEWKGIDSTSDPMILMAHYDVVPVEASANQLWTAKPFGGEVKNNNIWGRGAIDDKVNVISILEAAEALLKKGFTPKQNILFCFGCNEESSGIGAQAIVRYLEKNKVHASMVVDEGGEITKEEIKGLKRPIAVIGVAEKGYITFELSVEKPGGHSSQPANETAIDILAKALYKLRSVKPEARITPTTEIFLLNTSSAIDDFFQKIAVNNLWLFDGLVKSNLSKTPSGNAMIRTTIVPTILNSGVRENVIPTNATAIVNCRILPGDTRKDIQEFIRKSINDNRVKINIKGDFSRDASAITDIHAAAYQKVAAAANQIMDSVITSPYIMLGATDSRSYRKMSDGVVNFSPVVDGKGYHGIDERLPISDLKRCISFFTVLMKNQ